MRYLIARYLTVCLGVAAVLASTPMIARAVVMYTAPVIPFPGTSLSCVVLNVSPDPIEITFDLMNGSGVVTATVTHTVDPLHTYTAAQNDLPQYCRFTFKGGKGRVRAHAVYNDLNGYTLEVPAQ
jgi:hypothetical protein